MADLEDGLREAKGNEAGKGDGVHKLFRDLGLFLGPSR